MLRSILSALAMLAAPAGAHAQLPAALEQALSRESQDAPAPERVALRMTVGGQSILVEIRPGGDEGETAYTLLQPASQDQLTEEQAEMWAGFDRDADDPAADDPAADSAPGETYAVGGFDGPGLREAIGESATRLREIDGREIYAFRPRSLPGQGGEAGERAALLENLSGEIEINPARNQITRVRFVLEDSFKPHLAARITEFVLEQRFVHEPAIDGPRFAGMTMSMAGSAVFQPFRQSMQIELVSVRYPGAEPLEAGAESP